MTGFRRAMAVVVSVLCGSLVADAPPAAGASALYRVVEVSGQAEGYDPLLSDWQPLRSGLRVDAGFKVRTGPDGVADLASDASALNALRIGPNARVTFLNAEPMRVSLDEGWLLVLKEDARELRILTSDVLVSVKQGGLRLESKAGPSDRPVTDLRVFAESVEVLPKSADGYSGPPKIIEEGFQFTETSGASRMGYPDYQEWQAWFKKNYERKDNIPLNSRT